jgi:hypothetical protein
VQTQDNKAWPVRGYTSHEYEVRFRNDIGVHFLYRDILLHDYEPIKAVVFKHRLLLGLTANAPKYEARCP